MTNAYNIDHMKNGLLTYNCVFCLQDNIPHNENMFYKYEQYCLHYIFLCHHPYHQLLEESQILSMYVDVCWMPFSRILDILLLVVYHVLVTQGKSVCFNGIAKRLFYHCSRQCFYLRFCIQWQVINTYCIVLSLLWRSLWSNIKDITL